MEDKRTIPEFLAKTYEMVNDQTTDHLVSWSPSGTSFVIWEKAEFTERLLSLFFNHNNFSSFTSQLNEYSFTKINKYRLEFANIYFVRGQPQLLQNIMRRPIARSLPPTDFMRHLFEEAEKLRRENRMLESKVEKLEEEKQRFEEEIERLKTNLESNNKGHESEDNQKRRECAETDNLSGKKPKIFEEIIKDKAKLLKIDLNSLPDSDVTEDPMDPPSTDSKIHLHELSNGSLIRA